MASVQSDPTHQQVQQLAGEIEQHSEPFRQLVTEVERVIVGQETLVQRLLLGLLTRGHLLIEGVPGLAKTLTVASLAKGINTGFQRLQFTPDLLPADLIGTQIYRPQDQSFAIQKGPIFSNLILADEINRAPAKVQSALLEAMQERQVTIGGQTFKLEEPFLVMATQNPVEQEGTYPLPEAQVDRFMLKVVVTYPTRDQERTILDRMCTTSPDLDIAPVMNPDAIADARKLVDRVYVDDKVKDYIVNLIIATREPHNYGLELRDLIEFGASPRATIALTLAAKANAFLNGRGYVTPQDVRELAMDVLRHRVVATYEAEAEEKTSEDIVQAVLEGVDVP